MIYFVHTDFYKYALFFLKTKKNYFNKKKIMTDMCQNLIKLTKGKIIIPTYNYDFPKTKKFDYHRDKSQVGVFSEFFRKKYKNNRTKTPMFSTCTADKNLIFYNKQKEFDPCGKDSEFDYLAKNKGKIIFFGADFAPSFIMYIERCSSNGALYRYKKEFNGRTYNNGKYTSCCLKYEVRPLSINIEYDLIKIKKDLLKFKILKNNKANNGFVYEEIDAKKFLKYGLEKLKKNPYFFLTKKTINMLKIKKKYNFKKITNKDLS
jgi:aminoglycoside 3-N-acetyltransferase